MIVNKDNHNNIMKEEASVSYFANNKETISIGKLF